MAFSTPASDTSLPIAGRAGGRVALPRAELRGSSLYRDAWRRLLRNKLAVVGGVIVVLLVPASPSSPTCSRRSPYTKTNFGRLNEFPSRDYPLGTDQLGRDLLSRMIYGARVSMLVGLGAQIIVVLIGVPIGALVRVSSAAASTSSSRASST